MKSTTTTAAITELLHLFSCNGYQSNLYPKTDHSLHQMIFSKIQWCKAHLLCLLAITLPPVGQFNVLFRRFRKPYKLAAKIIHLSIKACLQNYTSFTNNVAPCTLFLKKEMRFRFDLYVQVLICCFETSTTKVPVWQPCSQLETFCGCGQRVMVRNLAWWQMDTWNYHKANWSSSTSTRINFHC